MSCGYVTSPYYFTLLTYTTGVVLLVSDTEVVETRLYYEAYEEEFVHTAAEFLCARGGVDMMEVHSTADNAEKVTKAVEGANQRRWVVKKVFLDNRSPCRVERWSVKSYVDYVCTAGELLT